MPQATPTSAQFIAFMKSRRDLMLDAMTPELTRLPLYGGAPAETVRGFASNAIDYHLALIDDAEALAARSIRDITSATRHREAKGGGHLPFDGLIKATQIHQRAYLESGLVAVQQGVDGASEGIRRLLSAMDLLVEKLAEDHEHRELEQRERLLQFQMLADRSLGGIEIVNAASEVIYINQAGADLVGATREQLFRTPSRKFMDAEDLAIKQPEITRGLAEEGAWKGTLRMRRADTGELRTFEALTFMMPGDSKTPLKVVAMYDDITEAEEERAEARRLLEQRNALQTQMLEAQDRRLKELSTPLIPLSQKVLLMPLIGTIDAGRAGQIMEASLLGIARHRAAHLILDITGVPVIDNFAADALLRTSRAAKIIGARAWMTGISPAIARTLVQIQADLGELSTYGTVQEAVARLLRGKSL